MKQLTDAELIRLTVDELSKDAAEELFVRYLPKVRAFIVKRGIVDRYVVDDLAQETMVRALRKLPEFNRSKSFSSWIFGIAANCCREWLDKCKRRSALFDEELDQQALEDLPDLSFDSVESYFGDPAVIVMKKLEAEAVQNAISHLTEEQQCVVRMRFFGGASLAETAHALGKSVEAIESAQIRALRTLYRILRAEQTEG